MTIKTKLVGAFLLTASLVVLLSYFNVQAIQSTRNSFTNIVDNHTPRLNTLQNMRVIATRLDKETSLYESGGGEQQKNALLADIDKLTDQEKDYEVLIAKNADKASLEEVKAGFKPVAAAREVTMNVVFELIALKEQRATASTIKAKEAELAQAERSLERAITTAINQNLAVELDGIGRDIDENLMFFVCLE